MSSAEKSADRFQKVGTHDSSGVHVPFFVVGSCSRYILFLWWVSEVSYSPEMRASSFLVRKHDATFLNPIHLFEIE